MCLPGKPPSHLLFDAKPPFLTSTPLPAIPRLCHPHGNSIYFPSPTHWRHGHCQQQLLPQLPAGMGGKRACPGTYSACRRYCHAGKKLSAFGTCSSSRSVVPITRIWELLGLSQLRWLKLNMVQTVARALREHCHIPFESFFLATHLGGGKFAYFQGPRPLSEEEIRIVFRRERFLNFQNSTRSSMPGVMLHSVLCSN